MYYKYKFYKEAKIFQQFANRPSVRRPKARLVAEWPYYIVFVPIAVNG